MSWQQMVERQRVVFAAVGITQAEAFVLVAIMDHLPNSEPSVGLLATKTKMTERGVQKTLQSLEAKDLIRITRRFNRPSHYDLADGWESKLRANEVHPPNDVHPEPGSPPPRTTFTSGSEPGSPKADNEAYKEVDKRERSSRPRPPAKSKRRKAQLPIPSEWKPLDRHREKCASSGLDCNLVAEKFRLHALSVDRRQADWDMAFDRWLLVERPSTPTPMRGPQRNDSPKSYETEEWTPAAASA